MRMPVHLRSDRFLISSNICYFVFIDESIFSASDSIDGLLGKSSRIATVHLFSDQSNKKCIQIFMKKTKQALPVTSN